MRHIVLASLPTKSIQNRVSGLLRRLNFHQFPFFFCAMTSQLLYAPRNRAGVTIWTLTDERRTVLRCARLRG